MIRGKSFGWAMDRFHKKGPSTCFFKISRNFRYSRVSVMDFCTELFLLAIHFNASVTFLLHVLEIL